mmetsp:Transcript_28654/g.81977  ORF Transcript_28654/g.81977 Transcript_28654/m.81977 type:complete len:274 (+) Transcript_28654:2763-3584(+)
MSFLAFFSREVEPEHAEEPSQYWLNISKSCPEKILEFLRESLPSESGLGLELTISRTSFSFWVLPELSESTKIRRLGAIVFLLARCGKTASGDKGASLPQLCSSFTGEMPPLASPTLCARGGSEAAEEARESTRVACGDGRSSHIPLSFSTFTAPSMLKSFAGLQSTLGSCPVLLLDLKPFKFWKSRRCAGDCGGGEFSRGRRPVLTSGVRGAREATLLFRGSDLRVPRFRSATRVLRFPSGTRVPRFPSTVSGEPGGEASTGGAACCSRLRQ